MSQNSLKASDAIFCSGGARLDLYSVLMMISIYLDKFVVTGLPNDLGWN